MHYKDGTEVKVGDVFKTKQGSETKIAVVQSRFPGSDTCNITGPVLANVIEEDGTRIMYAVINGYVTANAKDSEKVA